MNEQMMKERIQQALNAQMSGVRTSPAERSELLENAIGGRKVKRKLTVGLVFAMVLVLMTAAAVATILLTQREIVEQVAVPMAVENDGEVSVNNAYTVDELAELVRTLNENGITLEENSTIMQALRTGNGYYEERVISEICQKAFGGISSAWTLEEQDWYRRMLAEIEPDIPYESCLPGEDNMTCEQAEAFAISAWKKKYGEELDPEDRNVYALGRNFYHDGELNREAVWEFSLEPLDLEHCRYTIRFTDRNPEATADFEAEGTRDWTKPYSGEELLNAFHVYGWNKGVWPQAAWQKLHEMMLGAELKTDDRDYREYRGYQLTAYPEPGEGELTREEAIRIAGEAVPEERTAMDSAVLTEYEGKRAWLVGLIKGRSLDVGYTGDIEMIVVTVDSASGKVESVREPGMDDDSSMAFVPEAAYAKAAEGLMMKSDYIRLAVEAVHREHPDLDIDLLDEAEYEIGCRRGQDEVDVEFYTKNIRHGRVSVSLLLDGTVNYVYADTEQASAYDLFRRYNEVYGYFGDWDQQTWAQLSRDMGEMKPEGIEGKLIQAAKYPAEDTVRIGREEAVKQVFQEIGKRSADTVNTCVLIDADPHPVWKMRVLMYDEPADRMIELDAETGEIVSNEWYKTDYTPNYALFSTEKDRRALELEMLGPEAVAVRELTYAFADLELDDPDLGLEDGSLYEKQTEGLTVRYTAKWAGMKDYEAELDEKGYVLRCRETDTEATEEAPAMTADPDTIRPDGKPWFWGLGVKDEAYWARMEQVMGEREINALNYRRKLTDWFDQYGSNVWDWPQDCHVLESWFHMEPWHIPEDDGSYLLFHTEGCPTLEELKVKAKKAFSEAISQERDQEWIDALQVQGLLASDCARTYGEGSYGKPTWIMTLGLYEYDEENEETYWNSVGFVLLDEDGTIREVVPELEGGG